MQHIILDSLQDVYDFIEFLDTNVPEKSIVAFDLETNSVNEVEANIYGIGLALHGEEGYYIPVRKNTGEWYFGDVTPEMMGTLARRLSTYNLIGHNIIYDVLVWAANEGTDLTPSVFADTILMKHTIEEEPPFGLKDLAVLEFGEGADLAQQELYDNIKKNGGATTKANMEMYKADTDVLGKYACFLPKSALITMGDGSSKFIEDVSVGESVITHTGNVREVYRVINQNYKGKIYTLEVENGRSIYNVTSEHPFLVLNQDTLKYEWKKVEEIRVHDLLVRGYLNPQTQTRKESPDFWWLLGFYQAEGHISKRHKSSLYTVFSIHRKELDSVLKILNNLGYKGSVCFDKRSLGCQVTVSDITLANKILHYTGGIYRCYEKRITKETLSYLVSNPEDSLNFIAGFMDGDGHIRKLKNSGESFQYKVETTSPHIVSTLDLLTDSLKLNSSAQRRLKEYKGRRSRYAITFFSYAAMVISGYSRIGKTLTINVKGDSYKRLVRVKCITEKLYEGPVHNISVEVDNSYVCNGLISHNCHDVMLTYKLFELYSKRIEQEGLLTFFYEDEVMPLYREVTIPMKMRGVGVDVELLKRMSEEAASDLEDLETTVLEKDIKELVSAYEQEYLNENFPVKATGNFPKAYANAIGLGELTSTAKKAIEFLVVTTPQQIEFKDWMQGKVAELTNTNAIYWTQRAIHHKKTGKLYVFNLGSKAQLKWLFFDKLGLDPLNKTETGEPQVDDAFLESISKEYTWVNKLRDINTINKMKSTYIDGILERTINGSIYTSFLQFGTTSGRFASRNPNLQNAPAPQKTGSIVDKYVNCVRDSIIARPGYKLIGADFSSLEPHIAAYVSGDPDLIDIFVTGKDFYSAIAIKQFGLKHLSAFKDDKNYLGNVDKDTRNKTKTYSLAAFYGAGGYRIAEVLKCEVDEANKLLEGYLNAFPGIRKFIERSHYDACTKGYVKTIFGRVRHLKEAKDLFDTYGHNLLDSKWARSKGLSEERRKFKNLMNNAVNFQIQGTAGHVMNRAMMLTNRMFLENDIEAKIVMTIHDEQIIEVREEHAEVAAEIIKWAMENAVDLSPIKLKATPIIGNSYGECK